jgi:hypothetical protein
MIFRSGDVGRFIDLFEMASAVFGQLAGWIAQRVRAKRGPMTGFGVIRPYGRSTADYASAFAL